MATVFVIQDIPGSKVGAPKINIIGATEFGNLKVLLPENSQIILSPAYVIQTLKQKLKDYTESDYLLLTGDPAIIGVACSIVSCLLYTSPSPRDGLLSRMPSSA